MKLGWWSFLRAFCAKRYLAQPSPAQPRTKKFPMSDFGGKAQAYARVERFRFWPKGNICLSDPAYANQIAEGAFTSRDGRAIDA
jgi:hypothetical protein